MSRLLAYIGRFAAIIVGFACASLAASAFLHLLVMAGVDWRGDESGTVVATSIVFSVPFVALFIGYLAFVPAAPFVLAAELLGLRGWLFHVISGAAIGLASAVLFVSREQSSVNSDPLLAIIAAGMVGGIAYWLIAGRSSGLMLDRVINGREPSGS